eukprot:TRINITY_DN9042_c0_g1_i1.p1 TRINITY_DN9042_c0_g1~~TRINITY_DN9042_c0_g1_i1.p1  ORF type:complete len:240 (-),score=50.66 TRINITY_DN9042_c0_g1_i1:131-805(-)
MANKVIFAAATGLVAILVGILILTQFEVLRSEHWSTIEFSDKQKNGEIDNDVNAGLLGGTSTLTIKGKGFEQTEEATFDWDETEDTITGYEQMRNAGYAAVFLGTVALLAALLGVLLLAGRAVAYFIGGDEPSKVHTFIGGGGAGCVLVAGILLFLTWVVWWFWHPSTIYFAKDVSMDVDKAWNFYMTAFLSLVLIVLGAVAAAIEVSWMQSGSSSEYSPISKV